MSWRQPVCCWNSVVVNNNTRVARQSNDINECLRHGKSRARDCAKGMRWVDLQYVDLHTPFYGRLFLSLTLRSSRRSSRRIIVRCVTRGILCWPPQSVSTPGRWWISAIRMDHVRVVVAPVVFSRQPCSMLLLRMMMMRWRRVSFEEQ